MESPISHLPEVESDPLSDLVLNFLIDHDQEEPYLDFKLTINIDKGSNFPEIAKDFLAFSNYGGGMILVGYRDKSFAEDEREKNYPRKYVPVGLPDDFHLDQTNLQSKFDPYSIHSIAIGYREFSKQIEGVSRRFAEIYIPPSSEIMKAAKTGRYSGPDGRTHTPFEAGTILFRHGTQSKPATKSEIDYITRRVKDTQYKLSVLSGQPDRVKETIYSNLFEAKTLPRRICTGKPKESFWTQEIYQSLRDYVSIYWKGKDVTFENLSDIRNPLWQSVTTDSIVSEETSLWLADADKRRIVEKLLNAELNHLARTIGLRKDPDRFRFFFPCPSESLTITWSPRFKESSELLVAKKTYSAKLHKNICIHLAVTAQFTILENRVFLRLSPSLLLTSNGADLVPGEQVGPQITSLLHNRYNQSYLNNLLFWIAQFSKGGPQVSLAHDAIRIDSTPATTSIEAGILADRPVSEGIPELVTGEAS